MTVQEALEFQQEHLHALDRNDPNRISNFSHATMLAIEALESQTKYRWHDLKKDPDDLPDDEEKKIAVCETKKGTLNYVMAYYSDRWVAGMNSNVIAWREIEPFEVEE